MKDKHITVVLVAVLAVVFIGGAVNHYSPDVCPETHNQTTQTIPTGGITEQ